MVTGAVTFTALVLSKDAGVASPILASDAAPGEFSYFVDKDTIIATDMILHGKLPIFVAQGCTLTIEGDFIAPASQIFFGPGKVDMRRSKVLFARPEWWGARPNDLTFDCAPALTACLDACIAMRLGPGDYFIPNGWRITQRNRRIEGVGRARDAFGTRLLRFGSEGAVVTIGTDTPPPSFNDHVTGIDMRSVELARTAAPLVYAEEQRHAVGLRLSYVLDCSFHSVRATEQSTGFDCIGAVRTFFADCTAFRSLATPAGQPSAFVGFDLRDNASLYLNECSASRGGPAQYDQCIGLRLRGKISDHFITRFESTAIDEGIVITGDPDRRNADAWDFGQINVHIDSPIVDQASQSGIRIESLSRLANIDMAAPYVALASGAGTAIGLNNCLGNISITGGQLFSPQSSDTAKGPKGLAVSNSAGLIFNGLKINNFPIPLWFDNAQQIDGVFTCNHLYAPLDGPAIRLTDSRMIALRPQIRGINRAFSHAVAIDGRASSITIATAGLDGAKFATTAIVQRGGNPLRSQKGQDIRVR